METIHARFALHRARAWHATRPLELLLEKLLGLVTHDAFELLAFSLLLEVIREVALISVDGFVFHLQNFISDILEEIAVVRNHEDGHVRLRQKLL